jgi:coproporphyrinogen III oxidase
LPTAKDRFFEDKLAASMRRSVITRVMENSALIERARNFSQYCLATRCRALDQRSSPRLASRGFEALGVSLVIIRKPHVPTTPMPSLAPKKAKNRFGGFGGGFDPNAYGVEEDCDALAPYWPSKPLRARSVPRFYRNTKPWIDRYFHMTPRASRAVAGCFR